MADAAAGLTRVEAENAFALSLVRHGRLAPEVLWELKAQALKKSGLLTLHRGGERFEIDIPAFSLDSSNSKRTLN